VSLLAVPGRRTVQAVAALSAAVLIALQIPAEHWFYLYIPWFFGLYMAAIVAPEERAEWPRTPRPAAGAARSSWPGRRP
jgi:hypothetical protein